jgi:predicted deacetylase
VGGKIEDFDTQSKEQEKQEIQGGLDILSAVNLRRPCMFIPPAWHLSRQCIEALKELNFSMSESMTDIEFIQKGKKYILQILRIFQRGMSELVN